MRPTMVGRLPSVGVCVFGFDDVINCTRHLRISDRHYWRATCQQHEGQCPHQRVNVLLAEHSVLHEFVQLVLGTLV